VLQAGVVVTKWQQLFCLLHKSYVYQLKSKPTYQNVQDSVLSRSLLCSSSTSLICSDSSCTTARESCRLIQNVIYGQ
jgi:hypothetical protein